MTADSFRVPVRVELPGDVFRTFAREAEARNTTVGALLEAMARGAIKNPPRTKRPVTPADVSSWRAQRADGISFRRIAMKARRHPFVIVRALREDGGTA